MRTEIIKIIEGGLTKSPDKVRSYAQLLSQKLRDDGEERFADRIVDLLNRRSSSTHQVLLDEFSSAPVDHDSRLDMLDIWIPDEQLIDIVLPEVTQRRVDEYIGYLSHRSEFIEKGLELPDSLLLYGPPGCGKTTIAHYISKRTGLPLLTARLDGIVSSLLGSTAKNIRRIFDYANERPCILFLDEFDAVAKARSDDSEVGELKRVVNSLLQNIDVFNENNILVAATNHEQLLDTAVWRRFSNVVEVSKPGLDDIAKLLRLFFRDANCDFLNNPKRLNSVCETLYGLSPSDIRVICYSAIRDVVVSEASTVTFAGFMYKVALSTNRAQASEVIEFLSSHGVSQLDISRVLNVSVRQVRNTLEGKRGVGNA
ncbi:MAG: ATP-binding protein [Alicyclobacillaceae bacterium]|nr:ATP-binding protein [Alicyclobacillaceae bacterium]